MSQSRDQLAHEVSLLGKLLGEVIIEQAGRDAFDLVERVRHATIAARRSGGHGARDAALAADLERLDLGQVEVLIRAFGLYFQLTNLADEKQRIRRLRERARSAGSQPVAESVAAAISELNPRGNSAADVGQRSRGRPPEHRLAPPHGTCRQAAWRRARRLSAGAQDPHEGPPVGHAQQAPQGGR